MRHALKKNWTPKIVSLILAIAIWFLIRGLQEAEGPPDVGPMRAIPATD